MKFCKFLSKFRFNRKNGQIMPELEVKKNEVGKQNKVFRRSDSDKRKQVSKREKLLSSLKRTSAVALTFAIAGILMMIVANELSYIELKTLSNIVRMALVVDTVILVALVIQFHVHEFQVYMNESGSEYWQNALSFKRCVQILIEVLICAMFPPPLIPMKSELDIFLSIGMFGRLYWLSRVMLLHSKLYSCVITKSIAGFNRVKTDTQFYLKRMLILCPGQMLLIVTITLWFIAGYIFRLCEWHQVSPEEAEKYQSFLNNLWIIAVTFLTIGYGDIVPSTYCGRMIAISAGVLGLFISSIMIAVIVQKLELTRAQENVHNFIVDLDQNKMLKYYAANVIRETWKLYRSRNLVEKINVRVVRHHQRKLILALTGLRKLKKNRRILEENRISLGDVSKASLNSLEMIRLVYQTQEALDNRVSAVESELKEIKTGVNGILGLLKNLQIKDVNRPQLKQQSVVSIENEDNI